MAIIEARGLARTFKSRKRTVEAVRGVDLTVGDGEIVGFLGPNGAGKTTTLRMLTTLLRPTAGTATVAGADLLRNPLRVTGEEAAARKLLGDQAVVREISAADETLKLTVEHGEQALPALLRVLDAAAITLESINLSRPTLDDVFLTLTGRSLRDDSPASHPAAEAKE
jgi:ABC-2 type transport system ATP-binding protein